MTNQNLKFIKVNTVPTSDLIVGAIYFEASTHLLKVAISATEIEVYSGVQNVVYNETSKTLTFTMPDGSSKIVNFGALDGKAENTITITGTDGLTGGGNLKADRTISHAVPTGATVKASGFYKIATDKFGHVNRTDVVEKSDITNLGIPGSNTTYTFTEGINKFTVKPSDGQAVDINITPNINNNVIKSEDATTSDYLPKFVDANGTIANGYSIDSTLTSSATAIPTAEAVSAAIDSKIAAADAMIFKGTIGTSGTVTDIPATGYKTGWTYKVITTGTYAGIQCEIGDMIIALKDSTNNAITNSDWTVIQTNIDGAVIGPSSSNSNHVAIFSDATGKIVKDSGFTIATSVPKNAKFTDDTVKDYKHHYKPTPGVGIGNSDLNRGLDNGPLIQGDSVITSISHDPAGHVVGVWTQSFPEISASKLGAITTIQSNSIGEVVNLSITQTGTVASIDCNVSLMKGCSVSQSGVEGLVPAPTVGKQNAFLRGDGTWVVPTDTNTTYKFENGSNGSFSVTPKDGAAQTVNIGKPAAAGTADQVANSLAIQLNGTTNTTYNGSEAKTINITPAAIGAVSNITLSSDTLSVSNSGSTTTALTVDLVWTEFD